jgi:hypothetical protein
MTAWHATSDAGFGPYTMLDLYDGATYRWEPTVTEGQEFTAEIEADQTIRVAFDPAVLIEI